MTINKTEPTTPYPVGTKARKVGGTYQADVTVIAVGVTSTGAVRYLCEFDALPGMLHVFNGGQLEVKEDEAMTTGSERKYKPHRLFSWWCWYWAGPDHTHESYLPRNLFDLLRGGKPYEDYRRDYLTRVEAMCDLTQARAALKAQEEQTVTTTTTQGEPIELEKVRREDVVLVVRTYSNGYEQTARGVVMGLPEDHIRLALPKNSYASWRIDSGADYTTSVFLLHRPPRRVEISKKELIESTPIGTRVVLTFLDGDPDILGVLLMSGRDRVGLFARVEGEGNHVVYMDDIKAIYTEEVQG